MKQNPSAKARQLGHCLWIGAAFVALSFFMAFDSPRRWHGVVPWLTFREDTIGIGTTSLALGYSILAFAVVRGIMNAMKRGDD